jgi:hypothetical protein
LGAVLLTVVCTGSAMGWFHDYFPVGADGSLGYYSTTGSHEGYSAQADGDCRFAMSSANYGFLDFRYGISDGFDKARDGHAPDKGDGWTFRQTYTSPWWNYTGVTSPSWFADKMVVNAYLYIKSEPGTAWCDVTAASGTYISDPITVLGLRCGNLGGFNDRGYNDSGALAAFGSAGATYDAAYLYPGQMSGPAWRIGIPAAGRDVNNHGIYSQLGDVGTSGTVSGGAIAITMDYWKTSVKEPNANLQSKVLQAGTSPFDPESDGFGGWSGVTAGATGAEMFAIKWLVRNSTAHLANSTYLDNAHCAEGFSGDGGTVDPRNASLMAPLLTGWFAVPMDRAIVELMAAKDDAGSPPGASDAAGGVKGLILVGTSTSIGAAAGQTFGAKDQGSGVKCAYLDLRATYKGDCSGSSGQDAIVNSLDVSYMASHWNVAKPNALYVEVCDFNEDGRTNTIDLSQMAANWNKNFMTITGSANKLVDFPP